MFVRTDLGLGSEHLFHGVDFVVYCEGSSVDGEAASLDELFWQRIFSEYGIEVYCKSLGSKTVLKPLAEKVIADDVQNTLVAMDRDYDDLRGGTIKDRRVFYTFGYSWESDVFSSLRVEKTISLFVTIAKKERIVEDFEDYILRQTRILKRLTLLDFKYIAHEQALFDRQKPMSIISTPANEEPSIKVGHLLANAKEIRNFQTAQISRDTCDRLNGLLAFYGKALGRLIFHWFVYRTKKIAGCRKAMFDTFAATSIENLVLQDNELPRNEYYASQISRL